jgi:hypothetical protein
MSCRYCFINKTAVALKYTPNTTLHFPSQYSSAGKSTTTGGYLQKRNFEPENVPLNGTISYAGYVSTV